MKEYKDYSLLKHNTFGIDAKCSRYIAYSSTEDACKVALQLTKDDRPLLILGGGSNLLLTDDYPGTVVSPEGKFEADICAEDGDSVLIKCWAGATVDDVIGWAIEQGLYGLENLSLIPGQVGASAVQNIGAYGAEAKDYIVETEAVEIATGKVVVIKSEDCNYAYRQSKFKHEWKDKYFITHVTYRLSRVFAPQLDYGNIKSSLIAKIGGTEDDLAARITPQLLRDTIIEIRKSKLPEPEEFGNAGSFFMNPIVGKQQFEELQAKFPNLKYFEVENGYKIPAGWLIDQCGWKGKTLGNAGVWPKQALVLYNCGGASGQEIVSLCEAIRNDVKHKFNLDIHPEVNIR